MPTHVLFDIKGVFDNVDPGTLYTNLASIRVSKKIADFIYYYAAYRLLYFVVDGNLSEPKPMTQGPAQGCVLGPIVFNLYSSQITRLITDDVDLVMFADGIAPMKRWSNLTPILQTLNTTLNSVQKYLLDPKLEISEEKLQLVIFTRKHFSPANHHILLNGHEVIASETARFLGTTLDHKLTFSPLIDNLRTRNTQILSMMKFLSHTGHGADPRALLNFYKGRIRSSLEYGSDVFLPSNLNKAENLDKIQYKAIRLAVGLRPQQIFFCLRPEKPL